MISAAQWTYLASNGKDVLAIVRRDDEPPSDLPVRIGGDGGLVRHYIIREVYPDRRQAILHEALTR